MEDTPSNYNVANQRYELGDLELDKVKGIEEEENSDEDLSDLDKLKDLFSGGMQSPKVKKGKKKKKKKQFQEVRMVKEPTQKEKDMAKAYGGSAKPTVVTQMVPVTDRSGGKKGPIGRSASGFDFNPDSARRLNN